MILNRLIANRLTRTLISLKGFKNHNGNDHRRSLVSRTISESFENKSLKEVREELRKRGITTESRKKSVLVKKLLENEKVQRGLAEEKDQQIRKVSTAKPSTNKKQQSLKTNSSTTKAGSTTLTKKTATSSPSPSPSSSSSFSSENRVDEDLVSKSTSSVLNSPTKVVARLVSETEAEVPIVQRSKDETHSSILGSPKTNLRGESHEAKNWPASIVIPITAEENPVGTAIPFIPDNYDSYLQSHSIQLDQSNSNHMVNKNNISTASHPSTLPGGGPSLVVNHSSSSSSSPSINSINVQNLTRSDPIVEKRDLFGSFLGVKDGSEVIRSENSILKEIESLRSSIKFKSTFEELFKDDPSLSQSFKFEDRSLSKDEISGIVKIFGGLVGVYIAIGFFE